MREIKLRTWDNVDKYMCYVSLDDFLKDINEDVPSTPVFHFGLAIGRENAPDVMQYTGLKDKNGKEIYEGDIVNIWHIHGATEGEEHVAVTVEVVFRSPTAAFCLRNYDEEEDYPIDVAGEAEHILEVIGNIYENPELLK